MFISQILVTTWLAFSGGQAVHDDYAKRRQDVSANFIIGDDNNFCTGWDCGADCWRPLWCRRDTRSCPGGVTLRRCGASCRFPRCPTPMCPADVRTCPDGTTLNRDPATCEFPACPRPICPADVKTCPDGTTLNRDPATCEFPACPQPPSCSPSLGFHTCPDGSRVGRDPNNLCITWLPCPTAFRCRNGQQIPMNRVCDGIRDCFDGSDEWDSHGCQQFGIGRRREESEPRDQEDALELMKLESTDDLDQRRRQSRRYNCYSKDSQWRWTVGKQRWCCSRRGIACQYVTPSPAPSPRFNCYTRERWSSEKRRWCCANRGLGCRDSQNEYTPDGEYNCYYGRQSSWTWQKRSFCCSDQRIGCNSGPTSPSGPSIGGRRTEVELNEEPELDREE